MARMFNSNQSSLRSNRFGGQPAIINGLGRRRAIPPRPTPGLWFPSPNLLPDFFLRVGDPHGGGRGTQIQGGARGSVDSVAIIGRYGATPTRPSPGIPDEPKIRPARSEARLTSRGFPVGWLLPATLPLSPARSISRQPFPSSPLLTVPRTSEPPHPDSRPD